MITAIAQAKDSDLYGEVLLYKQNSNPVLVMDILMENIRESSQFYSPAQIEAICACHHLLAVIATHP